MKITIEPDTDEEKANPQLKRVVLPGMGTVAVLGIPAEHLDQTALYYHAPALPLLQQRIVELNHQLTKARFIAEAAQAQQPPRIQVAQPNIPFPGGNDRIRT